MSLRITNHGLLVCLTTALLAAAGCSKKPTVTTVPPKPAPSGPKDPELRVSPAGYHGRHFAGPVPLPRSSALGDGTTLYDVVYQKKVTVISRSDASRSLVAIRPGGVYVFTEAAQQIAHLQPDTVVLLSGLALRTVVSVEKTDEGYLLKTTPAKITDAIKSGRLEGTYRVDFNRMRNSAEYDVDFSGFRYHIRFVPAKNRINFLATIKYAGSQGSLAYAGTGFLSNFVSVIRMQIKDGMVTKLDFLGNNVAGQMDLKWYAAANDAMRPGTMAKITSWPAELYKNSSLAKAAYDVPIVLGAIPFDLRLSLGFSFIPDFTAKNSLVEGSKLTRFGGNGGFNFADGQTKSAGSFKVDGDIDVHDSEVAAEGPVGFTAAAEAPRLDLALGWPPDAPPLAGYLNFVTSYGIVTNGSTNPAPCRTNILASSVNAGAAYSSPNTFAQWPGTEPGTASSVSLSAKTFRAPGERAAMCPQ